MSDYTAPRNHEGSSSGTRSSLDTFIIPGRIRFPSSRVHQPGPVDIQIAQNLLQAESRLSRRNPVTQQVSAPNPPQPRRSVAHMERTNASDVPATDPFVTRAAKQMFPPIPFLPQPRQSVGQMERTNQSEEQASDPSVRRAAKQMFPPIPFLPQPRQSVDQMERINQSEEQATDPSVRRPVEQIPSYVLPNLPRQSTRQTESTQENEEETATSQDRDTYRLLNETGSAAQDARLADTVWSAGSHAIPRKPVASPRSALDIPRRRQTFEETPESPTRNVSRPLNEAHVAPEEPQDHSFQSSQVSDTDDRQLPYSKLHPGTGLSSQGPEHDDLAKSYDGPRDISSNAVTTASGETLSFGHRDTKAAVVEYNWLSTEHEIAALSVEALDGVGSDGGGSTENTSRSRWNAPKWFSNVLKRSTSSYNINMKTIRVSSTPPIKKPASAVPLTGTERPKEFLSLEEFCKLGGILSLKLPQHFAARKSLVVPACVATLAYYILDHGLKVPGIFRVSGQQSTINALYDYYSIEKFAHEDGGKPLHTATKCDLPDHIDYTVHDVTSVLKKIISGFEGGLLGSSWLLEAFQDIEKNLRRKPDQSEIEFVGLKAKFIALAILSVTSGERFNLICAILGLASMIGHESEKLKAQSTNASSTGELMTYQALGVIFGPSLLVPDSDKKPTALPESSKKSRKQKKDTVTERNLNPSPQFQEACRQVESQVKVAEMLISNWQDVIKQMQVNDTETMQRDESSQRLASEGSKYSLSSSREGPLGLSQGAQSTHLSIEPSRSAWQTKISSRSSSRPDSGRMSRLSSGASTMPSQGLKSSGSSSDGSWFHHKDHMGETDSSESAPMLRSAGRKSQTPRQLDVAYPTRGKRVQFAGTSRAASQETPMQSTHLSDETILPHPHQYPSEPARVEAVGMKRQQENLRLPDAGMNPSSNWPLRHDGEASLHSTDALDNSEHHRVKTIAERFSPPSHGHYVPDHHESGANPTVYADVNALPVSTQLSTRSLLEKDKISPSQRARNANVRAKESLIPKPVHESGRGRRTGDSHSPSPPKETTPITQFRPRPSALNFTNVIPSDHFAFTPGSATAMTQSHSPSMSQDSDATVSRNVDPGPSGNLTNISGLYEENRRLREALARKDEQKAQARRSLEIARETGSLKDKSSERSGSSHGKEEVRKEMEFWKKRAQELERELDEKSQTAHHGEQKLDKSAVAEGAPNNGPATQEEGRWRDTM